MVGSPRFSLDATDVRKIAKGALIAVVGAVLTYFGTVVIPELEKSEGLQGTSFVLICVVFNAVWKWWRDNQNDVQ